MRSLKIGLTDGTCKGKVYFRCEKRCGFFLALKSLIGKGKVKCDITPCNTSLHSVVHASI